MGWIVAAVLGYLLVGAAIFAAQLNGNDPEFRRNFDVLQGTLLTLMMAFWPLFVWDLLKDRMGRD